MPAVSFESAVKNVYTVSMSKKWIVLSLAAVCAGAIGGVKLYADYQEREEMKRKQAAYDKTMDSLKVDIDPDLLACEYGGEYDLSKLVRSHTGEMSIAGEVDPMKAGAYEITVSLSDLDSYGETVEREFLYSVSVTDTKAPEIILASDTMTSWAGEETDLVSNIESVTDPVDGELAYSETEENGSWTLSADYDPEIPGDYTVNVKAVDLNGNASEAQFTLTIAEKPSVPASAGNNNPYFIRINRALNTVTVYALDGSGYVPYTAFICSTGPATPLGTYSTFNKSRWRLLYGPCYGQYVTDIVGDILFHSVPYYTMNEGDLEYNEYNKLGTAASMGCIRLCVRNALWIYNNCPIGTVVELYDDWDSYGPLGRPESICIDPESPNRGWDPTDPSENNPWNR